jgi:hypothetical protein
VSEWHVYLQTVVSMSEWSDMSIFRLLFQCQSGATCLSSDLFQCQSGATCLSSDLFQLVVHRSSETSTNQSDVIIRSDDWFLNLVVDSDSIVSKIYMLNFGLGLFFCFFFVYADKNIAILSQLVFFALILTNIWQFCPIQAYFWHSVNTHIWTSLLFIYFPE